MGFLLAVQSRFCGEREEGSCETICLQVKGLASSRDPR
ncbi:unnamed protein product, partial [marine sediment metagenome]